MWRGDEIFNIITFISIILLPYIVFVAIKRRDQEKKRMEYVLKHDPGVRTYDTEDGAKSEAQLWR